MTAHAFQKMPTLRRARPGMPRISRCLDDGDGLAVAAAVVTIASSTADVVVVVGGVGFSDSSAAGWRSPVPRPTD